MSYSPPSNDAVDFTLEDFTVPANDAVDFTLAEEAVTAPEEEEADRVVPLAIDWPTQIDIPLSLNLRTMAIETGTAVFLVGVMATTGGASILARNWPAAIMWGLAFVILIVGSLLGLGLEIFWLSLALVILLLMAGLLVRWAGV